MTQPNTPDQSLRQLILRLRLNNQANIDNKALGFSEMKFEQKALLGTTMEEDA